ncbi:MAG: A-macroglobulin complement component, partial [Acidobacteria bacterium]
SNKSSRFGSTQSTVLALRSIVAYDNANARPKAPGRILLSVDGRTAGAPLAFTASNQGALVLPDFTSQLVPGKHTVALKMEDGSSMPFSISIKYNNLLPDSAKEAQVGLQVVLKDAQVQEGNVTEAVVSIANESDQAIPTPVAIVGIPGGLEVRHDQLKELVKSGKIDAYEVIGREVVLYWRYLKAKNKFDVPLSLVAAIPGSYTGPASRAYLYYTDEFKNWAPGLKVNITRR